MFRDVPECSGMFRDVPCSWFYRRPFIDVDTFYSLPADVLWGSFVTRDKRTPKDVCGEAILFICFWIDLVRLLATTGNTSAVAGYTRV